MNSRFILPGCLLLLSGILLVVARSGHNQSGE